MATYTLEFYEDDRGDKPVLRWIREGLTPTQRYELGQAMREQLQEKGVGVCATEYGKQLGKGLFEFTYEDPDRFVLKTPGTDQRSDGCFVAVIDLCRSLAASTLPCPLANVSTSKPMTLSFSKKSIVI